MARSVWTGTLSFGLVAIPVSVFPATSPKDVRFHLFDRQGRRVRYRRVAEEPVADEAEHTPHADEVEADPGDAPPAPVDGSRGRAIECGAGRPRETMPDRGLAFDDLVRGYEIEPGRFAMVEREELERVRPERSTTIELEDFVRLADVDPVYFEKTYYLAPRRDAVRPYTLLRAALERTDRAGIGRFVLRTKPHLVAIRATTDALALQILYFGDEVRSASEVVGSTGIDVPEREVRIAEELVRALATTWDPDRYADHYRQELLELISEKEPTSTAGPTHEVQQPPGVEALMEALKRSVEAAKEQGRTEPPRRHAG